MNQHVGTSTLKVPGASIYYERKGTGPMLLLIAGGPTDAGVFAELSRHLAGHYTVVAYDPRGNSRSTFDGAPQEQRLDVHADDAAQLIEALGGGEPAYVFGTSGGAQIALELAVRHPDRVRTVVVHEPPCLAMLDDASKEMAENQAILDTYHRDGVEAATHQFMVMAGMAGGPEGDAPAMQPSPEEMETFGRIEQNFGYFIAFGLVPLSNYRPNVDELRAGKTPVVVAIGEESAGQITDRTSRALAAKLGVEPVTFPGDHGGYGFHAEAFAERLRRALGS